MSLVEQMDIGEKRIAKGINLYIHFVLSLQSFENIRNAITKKSFGQGKRWKREKNKKALLPPSGRGGHKLTAFRRT